jgi:hypothetical protein
MKVRHREGAWVALYALLIVVLTQVPYGLGGTRAGEAWWFNGFLFGAEDGNAYLGKIRLGAEGDWSFHLFYTTEDHPEAFGVYLPFILVGQAIRLIFDPSPEALPDYLRAGWQVWRALASFMLILCQYAFIAQFLAGQKSRWLALLLSSLGGGLGWVLILLGGGDFLGTLPAEFYIPEGFSFLVLYGLPHVAMGRAAMLLGLVCFLQAWRKDSAYYALGAGLCWLMVGLMVTFYWAVLYVILAAWGLALWLKHGRFPFGFVRWVALSAGMSLPAFAYSFWLFQDNPAFRAWSAQNLLPSPHPLHYLIAYGVLGSLAWVGGRYLWRQSGELRQREGSLLLAWVLIVPVLVYLPINVQRRLAEGVLIPLVILAVMGLRLLGPRWRRRGGPALLLLLLPSSLFFFVGTSLVSLTPQCEAELCLYRPAAERQMLFWLGDNTPPGSRILASPTTGNYLPIATGRRPFWGLGTETLEAIPKEGLLEAFYRGEGGEAFLADYQLDYVIYGPLEKAYGPASGWNRGLLLIYDRDGYQVYEVP